MSFSLNLLLNLTGRSGVLLNCINIRTFMVKFTCDHRIVHLKLLLVLTTLFVIPRARELAIFVTLVVKVNQSVHQLLLVSTCFLLLRSLVWSGIVSMLLLMTHNFGPFYVGTHISGSSTLTDWPIASLLLWKRSCILKSVVLSLNGV